MKDSASSDISEFTDSAEWWHQIANRFGASVWAGIRGTGLPEQVALDVNKLTWMRFADHMDAVKPSQIERWLHETALRECKRSAKLFGIRGSSFLE